MARSLPVLVVDDEPLVLRALCRALRPGCEPVPAASAVAALELAATCRPLALVTEQRLGPGLSGLELVAALRSAGRPLPTVIVTATLHDRGLAAALASRRIAALLEKPWCNEALLLAVLRCLSCGGRIPRA